MKMDQQKLLLKMNHMILLTKMDFKNLFIENKKYLIPIFILIIK